jgi:hypothetical protein
MPKRATLSFTRQAFVLLAWLIALTTETFAQQSYCEIPAIQQLFLDIYVCQGLINCSVFGVTNYKELLALSDQDIRDRVTAWSNPTEQMIAQRNDAGAKYEEMGREIAANTAIASRKVIKSIKIVPSSGRQGYYECAVFFDFDLDAVATTELLTALIITMNREHGFIYKHVTIGLENSDITPFTLALDEAKKTAQGAVRSINRNTFFILVQNGTQLTVQAGGNPVIGDLSMIQATSSTAGIDTSPFNRKHSRIVTNRGRFEG